MVVKTSNPPPFDFSRIRSSLLDRASSGLRQSELFGLKWRDIDFRPTPGIRDPRGEAGWLQRAIGPAFAQNDRILYAEVRRE
jgi:integrase